MTSPSSISVMVALAVIFSTALMPWSAQAQVPSMLPQETALDLGDVPDGFEIEPGLTREQLIENVGPSYTIAMRTDPSPEHLAGGPVRIWQQVIRIDQPIPPVGYFRQVRDQIIGDQNVGIFPGGQNNATDVQLIGQADVDGLERLVFGAGRVRDNLIWFTLVEGAAPGTSIQSAINLNNVALAKYEKFRASNGAPALADALFRTPFLSDELPTGFSSGNIIRSPISDRGFAHGAVGEIDLQVDGPGAENRITFIVYPSEVQAQSSFEEAPARAAERGSQLARPDGYAYPVLCAMRAGELDGRTYGATSCLGLVGNVEVSASSLLADAEMGAMQDSLELMAAGVKHLQKVSADTSTR